MANEKFTPGPWFKVGESRNLANNVSSHRIDAHDGQLCIAYVTDYTSKEACDANAALIAAAPAMYEAIRKLLSQMINYDELVKMNTRDEVEYYKEWEDAINEGEAALAAANPETK